MEDVDLAGLFPAFSLGGSADDMTGNAITQKEQGYSDEDLVEYGAAYTLYPESQIGMWVKSLREPLAQIYNFSYYQGCG